MTNNQFIKQWKYIHAYNFLNNLLNRILVSLIKKSITSNLKNFSCLNKKIILTIITFISYSIIYIYIDFNISNYAKRRVNNRYISFFLQCVLKRKKIFSIDLHNNKLTCFKMLISKFIKWQGSLRSWLKLSRRTLYLTISYIMLKSLCCCNSFCRA